MLPGNPAVGGIPPATSLRLKRNWKMIFHDDLTKV
jgi:hypothetical protein